MLQKMIGLLALRMLAMGKPTFQNLVPRESKGFASEATQHFISQKHMFSIFYCMRPQKNSYLEKAILKQEFLEIEVNCACASVKFFLESYAKIKPKNSENRVQLPLAVRNDPRCMLLRAQIEHF